MIRRKKKLEKRFEYKLVDNNNNKFTNGFIDEVTLKDQCGFL